MGQLQALAEAEEALQLTRIDGNPIQVAQALLDCAQVRRHRLELEKVLLLLQEAESLLRPFGKTWELAQVLIELGAALSMQGKHDAAIALYNEVEPIYKNQANKRGLGRVWCSKGLSLCMRGSVGEGFRLIHAGEQLLAENGDKNMLTLSMNNRFASGLELAQSRKAGGDMFSTFIALSEAADAAWSLGRPERRELAVVASNTVTRLTHDLAESGEVDKAISVWAENEKLCARLGNIDGELASLGAQASLMRLQQYPAEEIRIVLDRAQTVAQRHPDQRRAESMMSMMGGPRYEGRTMATHPASNREDFVERLANKLNQPAHEVSSLVQEALRAITESCGW